VTLAWIFDTLLALAAIGMAVFVIAARSLFAAVIGLVTLGLLLALVWMRLEAPDVALAEAAIGGGATGVLLIGLARRPGIPRNDTLTDRSDSAVTIAAAVLAAVVAVALAAVVMLLPTPAPSLAPEATANLAATGLGNPVTAVLLGFRAQDTFLEVIALLLALLGVWSLARDDAWGGVPGPRRPVVPNGPLDLLARVLPPIGIVIGVHVIWTGSDAPGGEFQGCTLLAAMWVLLMLAGVVEPPSIDRPWLRRVPAAGPAVFLAVGLLGLAREGGFLAYPEGWAKPLILVIEIALVPAIVVIVAMLLAGPPERTARR
jgi:multisubunit Na+/H+ antiporter MnhB subunit